MASPVPLTTYQRRFEDIVRRFPEKPVFRTKTPAGYRDTTYRELDRQVKGVARGLIGLDFKPGMRAAVLSENRPEWVIAYLGVYMAGGMVVPLDAQISPAEWRNLIDDSGSQLVFVSKTLLPGLRSALDGDQAEIRLISLDTAAELDSSGISLEALVDSGSRQSPAADLPERPFSDVATIIYTSGTTGNPKGVMLTQENIVGEIVCALGAIRADETDTFLCLLPLQHVLSSIINVLLPIYLGAQINFIDTLKRSEILEALEEGQVSVVATVPQFFYLFNRRIAEELAGKAAPVRWLFHALRRVNRFGLGHLHVNLGRLFFGKVHRFFGSRMRLFVSGGSAFDPKVAQEFFDLGFTILQGYGLTETTGACTATREEENVIGSVGPPLPGVQVRIAQPDDAGVGEIAIRGPMVMKGYYKNEAGTAEVMQDGWFLSGDLGRIDARGNLFVTGRIKEIVVLPSGKNIYPDELEAHYGQCPYIQEIAVLGVSDAGRAEQGEKLHAVIVPDFDRLKSERIANAREVIRDEVAKWSNLLPKYKRLMSYQVQAEALPRTTTRKIKRLELKRLIESGVLRDMDSSRSRAPASADDRTLSESAAGREVLESLRATYRRGPEITLDMNLELDLGFDSMERIELVTGLEKALDLKLPDDFGADIHTVRDLIARLQAEVGASPEAVAAARQGWDKILSAEALDGDDEAGIRFSGPVFSFLKYLLARTVHLVLRVFFRLEARGLKNLPGRGAFLLCPNHLSYLDPFVVVGVLPHRVFTRVFFVGYAGFFGSTLMQFLARLAGVVPVDPDVHLLRAMKVGAWGLRRGRILCIFPEGGRSFDGELQEFRKGAAILAKEVGLPMIPVGIRGTREVWPRGSNRIRLHRISVAFGPPIRADSDHYQRITDRLRDGVAALLG